MNVRFLLLALAMLCASGCAMWPGHRPLECETVQRLPASVDCPPPEVYSEKELVMMGMAESDEIFIAFPKGVPAGALLSLFVGHFGIACVEAATTEMAAATSDTAAANSEIAVVHLVPGGSLEEAAQRLEQNLKVMTTMADIRLEPGGIPSPLDQVLSYEKLREVFIQYLKPLGTTSVDVPSLAALPTDFLKRTSVEPNLVIHARATPPPQDEYYVKQCGLHAINAERAWYDNGANAHLVNLSIVDSGLSDHVDLYGNAMRGYPPADHLDKNGHGTHVAGIIGAVSDDATGVVGVTWTTNITAYRFLNASGRGRLYDAVTQIKNALAANPRPHIVVLPWGAARGSKNLRETLEGAPDVLFVAPAGNSGQNACRYPVYPAAYGLENVISVMATTCDDLKAQFSNYGGNVDLAAPGEGLHESTRIYSTVLNDRWGNLAGTSMSAAFVAGAAALVLQPSISGTPYQPQQVKCWLKYTATNLGLPNDSMGRLNLEDAVKPLDETQCPRN